ncbi:hypothetical protein PHYBLDRAFT_162516 [Phycomyces blakesleeanus NRRL 1555(-)]|uniref:Uncharacterized protein n=1 Tax=Phycomyces blakesleeanus (strain ATCC 8743b / DSM 1359 / FGSC 10004 / NBRC 33097 / NRRL 1555) TaxID=763407 RepID=A0A167QBY5_PHYB8|nr:hypothetical protein PHYBLDRAFT_162516 [Phycomyces blakesleeanus NRRL 1555(-)]OAD79448.1 hypothetical protein PHYBLDRAFT_162516 [Phycomyces blakesleeanus NRRL 1555(-)]|eukprot:XP_018297488.1 hypothetical protein PHYBLDRAFT_162516 [Phycomyces blakesleeanus NRRL 1555(-)]
MYKQITRKMAPVTLRTPRSNARNSLTQVAVGCVEQHLICMTEMSTRLDNMGAILESLDNRFGQFVDIQRRNIKTVGAIAMSLTSTSRQVLPAVAPSAAPCGISECIYCLTSVGVTIMTSSPKSALGLPTKLAPYRSDTVYLALLCYPNMNMFLYVINPTSECLDHHTPSFNQMSEEETKVTVLALIREKIWKKDFRYNDPTEIAKNETRRR